MTITDEQLDELKAENKRLREALKEMADTESHAGSVCGVCRSNIGCSGALYDKIRTALEPKKDDE